MLLVDLGDEHVLAILFPVTRRLPQLAVDNLGRPDFEVSGSVEASPHVVFQSTVDGPAIGVPEDHAGRLFLQMEQGHRLAELAVIPFLRLLDHAEVGLQVFPVFECDPVNPLEHRVPAVAAPIRAGDRSQPKRVGGNLSGMDQVRTPAEVLPVAVPVHADVFAFRDGFDEFDLERLA